MKSSFASMVAQRSWIMYGGHASILQTSVSLDQSGTWDDVTCLLLGIAPRSPWFRVCSMPSLRPLAQKSLLAPYVTWTSWGSMRSARSKARMDVKGTASGAWGFSKTEFAYISSLIRWSLWRPQKLAISFSVSTG